MPHSWCLQGLQPLPLLVGTAIALAMLLTWFLQFRQTQISATGNLLEAPVMLAHLEAIAQRTEVPADSPDWRQACTWASASQAASAQIAEADPLLGPDLVETLYTVEGLVSQVAGSAVALQQVDRQNAIVHPDPPTFRHQPRSPPRHPRSTATIARPNGAGSTNDGSGQRH
jgi:hypothetical protein